MVSLLMTEVKQVYECTIDLELADAAVYAAGRCCVCTHQAQNFSIRTNVMAAISKV